MKNDETKDNFSEETFPASLTPFFQKAAYHLVVLFILAVAIGYWVKGALKPYLTTSPEDSQIITIKQKYDFKAAEQRLEEEFQKAQAAAGQQAESGQQLPSQPTTAGSCGS